MMLTVHGLPNKTKLQDVKSLIKQECNIPDFILDNLVDDGYDSKKVRIGLTNENDGYRLMKCLEGFRMSGLHVLKVVQVGKVSSHPQSDFEPRSSYNQPRNNYQTQSQQDYHNDYSRGQPSTNTQSHISQIRSKNTGQHERQGNPDRGLHDARQSLSLAMAESKLSRYQAVPDRRSDVQRLLRTQGSTDFSNPIRGPLAPPAIRPASLDSQLLDSRGQHGSQDTGVSHGSIRGEDGHNYRRPDHGVPISEPTSRQSQWTSADNEWSASSQPGQNKTSGYSYQQPQINNTYGPQHNTSMQSSYNQVRAPQVQSYVQPKIAAAPENPLSQRSHVLRSVELVDAPITPRALPVYSHQQKPITIMKENFQGPTQYNVTGQTLPQTYQGQGQGQQSWGQQVQGQTKQLAYDKSYDERRLAIDTSKAKPQSTYNYEKRHYSPPRTTRLGSPGRRSPRNIPGNTLRTEHNFAERRVSPARQFGDRHNIASTEFSSRRISPSKIPPAGRISPIRKSSPSKRVSPGRRISPFTRKTSPIRRFSPSRKTSPVGRRISPSGKHNPSVGKRVSPPGIGRRNSPFSRKISPTGRRISPPRHVSPIARHVSTAVDRRRASPIGRRVSPTGRRISPNGRRISPSGRRVSPSGRRISPSGRRVSPTGRQISPSGRRISPGRRVSPSGKRSPGRRMSPSMTQYDYYVEDERRMGVRVESPRRYSPKRSPLRGSARYSPSETKYEDISDSNSAKPIRPAYEPNHGQKYTGSGFRNETQYPAQNTRIEAKPSWQNEKIAYPFKKEDRGTKMGRPDPIEEKLSPRRSRSRSPVKDRYRRHSPSPRSPRRSWALEKRRSPDAVHEPPPPPLWPDQDSEKNPTQHPVWERKDAVEDRRFENKREKYAPRFSPRRDTDHHDYRDELKFERGYRNEDRSDYRRESPRRDEKKLFNEVDKDFDDIYQRAVEFRRKTEERKSNDRRNRSYDEDEHRMANAPRDRREKSKPGWIPINIQTKELDRTNLFLEPSVKEKRDKAVEEIANRMLEPHNFNIEQKHKILEELKLSIYKLMLEMFKDQDVSYIELVIKFRARYDAKDEEKILLDVLASFPNHYKNFLKRKGESIKEVPPKISRHLLDYEREDTRYVAHGHSLRMLTSTYESRKHAAKDGRIQKSGGLGYTNRLYTRSAGKGPLLNPSYKYGGNKISSFSASREYEEVYEEAKPKERQEKRICPRKAKLNILEKPKDQIQQKPKGVLPEEKYLEKPQEKKDKSQSVAALTRPLRYTELSPLMTKMVEDELKNIMINVWQTLPDDASNEADKLAVDTFKDVAGDDLRNTIGLNITKRLLNVHNRIFVKIKLDSQVPTTHVYIFANKYGITDIQEIETQIYTGKIQSWTHLDELYSVKNLKCGESDVTVTPVYQFMKCPPSLRTIFDGSQDYSNAKNREKEVARKIKKQKKVIVTADKVLAQEAMKPKIVGKTETGNKNETDTAKKVAASKTSELKSKGDNKETGQPKLVIKTATQAIELTKTVNKPEVTVKKTVTKEIKTQNQTTKVSPAKTVDKNPSVPTSTAKAITTPTPNAKKTPEAKAVNVTPTKMPAKTPTKPSVTDNNKTVLKPQPSEVKKPEGKVDKETANVSAKKPIEVVSKKPTKVVTDKVQAKIGSKEPAKVVAKEPAKLVSKGPTNVVAKVVTNEQANVVSKEPAKVVFKEPVKTKPVATNTPKKETANPKLTETKKPGTKATVVADKEKTKTPLGGKKNNVDSKTLKANGNDFDELDDHDILAMLSSGIVLDEC